MNKDELFVSEDHLEDLARTLPTPFYLYDEAGIRQAARRYRAAFRWNAGYRQFFPVKATPTAAILRLLHEEGCGMVCSSGAELSLCQRCGFGPRDVLFLPNYPLPKDVALAASQGVQVILDGPESAAFAAAGCALDTVGLRYNPGGEFVSDGVVLSRPQDQKFGLSRQALLAEARKLKALGTKAVGLHAYLRGNTLAPGYQPALARLLFELAVELREETNLDIAYVNLSGGLGIPYRPEDEAPDLDAMGRAIRELYQTLLAPAGLGNVPIYTEPGRYLTGPYGILVSRVVSIKRDYRDYMGLDASAADLMRPMMYEAYHHVTLPGKDPDAPRKPWDVVGGIAENTDKFAVSRLLPDPEIGDLCVIQDAGAHGHSMGYNYGGKLRCGEYLLQEDGSVRCIRRAETAEDYLLTQVFDL